MEVNGILSDMQFGFRKAKSSSDMLYIVNKQPLEAKKLNKQILPLFIDLAKAFGSIDRDILYKKLEFYSVHTTKNS